MKRKRKNLKPGKVKILKTQPALPLNYTQRSAPVS